MKIILNENVGRAFNLDGNELCVYSTIEKFTNGKGWYASCESLANHMPCVMHRTTVQRIVAKLVKLGLVIDDGKTLRTVQNAQNGAQNAQENVQIASEKVQNASKKVQIAPHIYNKEYKEREEENRIACDTIATPTPSASPDLFELLVSTFKKRAGNYTPSRETLTESRSRWNAMSPLEQRFLLRDVENGTWNKTNLEWLIGDYKLPKPVNLNGSYGIEERSRNEYLVVAMYNDAAGIYPKQVADDYEMKILRRFIIEK